MTLVEASPEKIRANDLVALSELRRALRSGAARRMRDLAGVSQAEFARALGVTSGSVHYYERGRRTPSEKTARLFIQLLCRLALSLREENNPDVERWRQIGAMLALNNGARIDIAHLNNREVEALERLL